MANRKTKVKKPARLRNPKARKELDLILFWTTLLVLTAINFVMMIGLIPFLLIAESLPGFILLAILGLFMGYIFSLLLHNIENLDAHHHALALVFIPTFSVVNLIIISLSLQQFTAALGLEKTNTLTVSASYIIFFLIPYVGSYIKR